MDIRINEFAYKRLKNFVDNYIYENIRYSQEVNLDQIFISNDIETAQKRNALDNYILSRYGKTSPNSEIVMAKYLEKFYTIFLENPVKLLGSPFLASRSVVEKFCPEEIEIDGKKVNLRQQVIDKYLQKTQEAERIYIKDKQGQELSEDEIDILMHHFIKNIGTDNLTLQNAQEAYIRKLMIKNEPTEKLTTRQIEFICKFVNNWMLSRGEYSEIKDNTYIYVQEDNTKGGEEEEGNIYINRTHGLTNSVAKLIHCICHETEHEIQEYEAKKDSKSKKGLEFAVYRVFERQFEKFKIYQKNYRVEDIEKDAEEKGFINAEIFLYQFGTTDLIQELRKEKQISTEYRQFGYAYMEDDKGNLSTRENFIFEYLNKAIEQNPTYIEEFPALKKIYNNQGNPKTFIELLREDFKVNEDDKSLMLEDFCKVYINKGELQKLDLSEFPEEMQANIASRLISILKSERIRINSLDKDQAKRISTFRGKNIVEEFALENSIQIIEFINNNYELLKKLQKEGKFSSIINMDHYDSELDIFSNPEFYKNLILKNSQQVLKLTSISKQGIEKKEKSRTTVSNIVGIKEYIRNIVRDVRLSEIDEDSNKDMNFEKKLKSLKNNDALSNKFNKKYDKLSDSELKENPKDWGEDDARN